MNPNYPSASQAIRNMADLKLAYQIVHTDGRFRIVHFESPFVSGSEFWVINEKGFLWEPANNLKEALEYLQSEEATEYQSN
jgi:hypothetical protein